MKRVFWGVLVLALSAMVLAACGGSSDTTSTIVFDAVPAEYAGVTSPFGADAAVDGAEIFKTNCESCHGSQGHGDGPASTALDPAPKNLPELAAQVDDDYLYWRINTGKEGTAMIAWNGILTEEQIWQAVAYIRTLK